MVSRARDDEEPAVREGVDWDEFDYYCGHFLIFTNRHSGVSPTPTHFHRLSRQSFGHGHFTIIENRKKIRAQHGNDKVVINGDL